MTYQYALVPRWWACEPCDTRWSDFQPASACWSCEQPGERTVAPVLTSQRGYPPIPARTT